MANITTVIPVYNGAQYIRQTLESLAAQTRRPDRVIAVDDGSTDATEEIVRSFREIQCEWVPNERNLGLFPNHNSALRFASETKFFHILHANDTISPTFFYDLIPLIENAPGLAMAFGRHVFIKEDGEATTQVGGMQGAGPRELTLKEFLESQTELKAIQLHSAVLKTDFAPCPIAFRTDLPQLGDVVFHSQFAARCSQIWGHPKVLSQVRIHRDSVTNRNIKNINAWALDEWKTMQLVYDLMRERGLGGFAREQKLKFLFAARSYVKVKSVRASDPAYADEIRKRTSALTGRLHWALAQPVVAVRDLLFPASEVSKERMRK